MEIPVSKYEMNKDALAIWASDAEPSYFFAVFPLDFPSFTDEFFGSKEFL